MRTDTNASLLVEPEPRKMRHGVLAGVSSGAPGSKCEALHTAAAAAVEKIAGGRQSQEFLRRVRQQPGE